jgi:hypothetical protein
MRETKQNLCQDRKFPNRYNKHNYNDDDYDEEIGHDDDDYTVVGIFMYIRLLHAQCDNVLIITKCRNDGIITAEGTASR